MPLLVLLVPMAKDDFIMSLLDSSFKANCIITYLTDLSVSGSIPTSQGKSNTSGKKDKLDWYLSIAIINDKFTHLCSLYYRLLLNQLLVIESLCPLSMQLPVLEF